MANNTIDLESCYEEAALMDEHLFESWIRGHMTVLCRRTEQPKLGYIVSQLNRAAIPCSIVGSSFHAPLLWVPSDFLEDAHAILDPIDDEEDDSPSFQGYSNTKPDSKVLMDWAENIP